MLKKCLIFAVSLIAIQSMTYATEKDDIGEDPTASQSIQTVVVKDDEPIPQPKGDDAPTVVNAHTIATPVQKKKNKSSCFACLGGNKEKD